MMGRDVFFASRGQTRPLSRAASADVMIQLFNSKCLPILYYGIDVCPLTNTQINSLHFVINSCYTIIFMIKSNDDIIRHCQDVFGCLPVADIVKRRTAKFLKKNIRKLMIIILCVSFLSDIDCQVTTVIEFIFVLFFFLFHIVYCLPCTCGEIKMYIYYLKGRGPASQNFWELLHARTRHEKQLTNFAR